MKWHRQRRKCATFHVTAATVMRVRIFSVECKINRGPQDISLFRRISENCTFRYLVTSLCTSLLLYLFISYFIRYLPPISPRPRCLFTIRTTTYALCPLRGLSRSHILFLAWLLHKGRRGRRGEVYPRAVFAPCVLPEGKRLSCGRTQRAFGFSRATAVGLSRERRSLRLRTGIAARRRC